ncbi:MAG: SRPBCC domain-containing protein [Demequina sp.]|jgi:uncharacterized protein YndB with AHSA1/START domain|nr:SRPBCC domain-containing protein [Demequina sp.]
MTIAHHDFTISRTYAYSPAQVFDMFADPKKKQLWFGANDDLESSFGTFDFRIGGTESAASDHPGGFSTTFDAEYVDIVPGERIVFTYRMTLNGDPLSASATSITLEPVEGGTLLTHTEHGIYLDGEHGAEGREEGTTDLLRLLGEALDSLA